MRIAIDIGISVLIILYFMDTDPVIKKSEPIDTNEFDVAKKEDWELTIGTSNKPFKSEKRVEFNEYRICKIDDYFGLAINFMTEPSR